MKGYTKLKYLLPIAPIGAALMTVAFAQQAVPTSEGSPNTSSASSAQETSTKETTASINVKTEDAVPQAKVELNGVNVPLDSSGQASVSTENLTTNISVSGTSAAQDNSSTDSQSTENVSDNLSISITSNASDSDQRTSVRHRSSSGSSFSSSSSVDVTSRGTGNISISQ